MTNYTAHATRHLILDRDGTLWLRRKDGKDWLGSIEGGSLEKLPTHLDGELEECRGVWAEITRVDERGEVRETYVRNRLPVS